MDNTILKLIKDSVDKFGVDNDIVIELTESKTHGDFSTNIAMKLVKVLKISPKEIAEHIKKDLLNDKQIIDVEIAGPGFINIFVVKTFWSDVVQDINKRKDMFGSSNHKRYVNIEYVSANPTGYLHAGHARGAIIGSVLVNIIRFAGNRVDSEYYINDAGNQINILAQSVYIRYMNLFNHKLTLPDDSYKGEDIIDCAKLLAKEMGDKLITMDFASVKNNFATFAKKYFLEQIKYDLKSYGVEIDTYSSETDMYMGNNIDEVLKRLSKHTFKKDGATWLNTTDFGDDKNRVLIKKDGTYTYFTPDIAYHDLKLSRGYDELINIWGADHIGYIKRMEVALGYLGLKSENLDILVVQMVKLLKNNEELKLSKRAGNTYTMKELLREINKDIARWYMVDKSPNAQFSFDVDIAKELSMKNPVIQVQYTHARLNQLINKSNSPKKDILIYNKDEIALIKKLNEFPKLILSIATDHKIHLLTTYLLNLTNQYNSYYSNNKIIGSDNEYIAIELSKAVKITVANGLKLLGISAPNSM